MSNKNTKSFGSRWGFVLASVGSAVGMANVWGFPNKLGSNGGGAFLLIYLLFIFIFSYVALPTEFAIGRKPEQEHLVLINMHGKQEVKKPVLQVDCLAGFHLQAPYVSRSVMRSSFRIF